VEVCDSYVHVKVVRPCEKTGISFCTPAPIVNINFTTYCPEAIPAWANCTLDLRYAKISSKCPGSRVYNEFILETTGTGKAGWMPWGAELTTVLDSDQARLVKPIGYETLSEIGSVSYWTYVTSTNEPLLRYRPWVGIYLDAPPYDGLWDYYLQAEPMYAFDCGAFPGHLNTWEQWGSEACLGDSAHPLRWLSAEGVCPDLPYEAPTLEDYINGNAMHYLTAAHGVQTFATREYGSLRVIKIKFMVGYGSNWGNFHGYVADITINNALHYGLNVIDGMYFFRPLNVDLNQDGHVDIVDLTAIAKVYGKSSPWAALVAPGGNVDLYDVVLVAKKFCKPYTPPIDDLPKDIVVDP
jgi:hypothetical protein